MKILEIIWHFLLFTSQLTSAANLQHESITTKLNHPYNLAKSKPDNINQLTNNSCGTSNSLGRISNGQPAKNCQFPFVAMLTVKFDSGRQGTCTGSLVAPRWILTAMHCLIDIDNPIKAVIVKMGTVSRKIKTNQQIRIVKYVVRLMFLVSADIGLAEVDNDFNLNSFVDVIALSKAQKYTPGLVFVAVGWGRIDTQNRSDVLQHANFTIHDTEECKGNVSGWSQYVFCSKGVSADSSFLRGDSGGPALIYDSQNIPTLIGINVATKKDNNKNIFWQLTTKISPYLSWINEYINES